MLKFPLSAGRSLIQRAASSSRNSPVSGITEQLPLLILVETTKSFPKFNGTGRSLLISFRPLGEEQRPTGYLKECIPSLTNCLVDVRDRDLGGLRIWNTVNIQDKVFGISFRHRDHLKPDAVWGVWESRSEQCQIRVV